MKTKTSAEPKTKLLSAMVGVAGEYFVAAELSRRGYIASIALKNTRGIDILVSNANATKSVGIQVKTSNRIKKDWMLNEKAESIKSTSIFYVLVNLTENGALPEFHIVPSAVVASYVKRTHRLWLSQPGLGGKRHNDSSIRHFNDDKCEFKDKWELLGL
jgi:hypothetical protein